MTLRRASPTDLAAIVALQHDAYEGNRALLGVEPLPLQADYTTILISHEVWLAEGPGGLEGVLILKAEPDHLLIWSIATAPSVRGAVSAIACWLPRRCGRASLGRFASASIQASR